METLRDNNILPKIGPESSQTLSDARRVDAAYHEFERLFTEERERARQRALAAALKAGFSSIREYEEASMKESARLRALARERIEKETGKSWEEYWETHPQRNRTSPEPFPSCDCEYHSIPFFCAKSLVDCRTQDAPDLANSIQAQGDQDLANLEIDPSSKSKRLSPEILEQYWQRETQDGLSQWPNWLKQDQILLRIKQQDARDRSQERLEARRRGWQRTVSPTSSRSVPIEERGDMEMADAARLPTPNSSVSIRADPSIMTVIEAEVKQQEAGTFPTPIKDSDGTRAGSRFQMSKRKTIIKQRTQLTGPSKVSKNAGVAKRHRGKEIRENSTRLTRSQKVIKFYELDAHGSTRAYRKYR